MALELKSTAGFAVVCALALGAGCTSKEGGDDPFGGDSSASIGIDGGDGDGIMTLDGDGGSGPRLDANTDGGNTTGSNDDGVNADGCTAIDFLFVIDNSGSMGDNQQNLVNSFPGFINAIQNSVDEANDYHVMVVKTDSGWGGDCQMLCPLFGFCPDIPSYDCNSGPPSVCDGDMGAGVTYPLGSDSSNMQCQLAGGNRFLTPAEPNLGTAFTCIASVGTDGDSSERPIEALTAAISTELNGVGGCNQGFLRDEAILVVTIITDEEDTNSPGIPAGWFQNVITRKSGDGSGIVMIGLINDTDAASPVCDPASQDPAKLREFIDSFPNSFRGSVCAPDYAQVLADAIALIGQTCNDYVPPAG